MKMRFIANFTINAECYGNAYTVANAIIMSPYNVVFTLAVWPIHCVSLSVLYPIKGESRYQRDSNDVMTVGENREL